MSYAKPAKPYQQYRQGYAMKDGRVLLAKCNPKFYGTCTPGCILGEGLGDADISNYELVNPEQPIAQYGLVCYYKGQAVGVFNGMKNIKSNKPVYLTVNAEPNIRITYSEWNRKVKKVWEKVEVVN